MGELGRGKETQLQMLDRKQAPNIFKSSDFSSCNVCSLTKISEKAKKNCTETTGPQCYIVFMND